MQKTKTLYIIGSLWLLFAVGLVIMQLFSAASVTVEWTTATELNTAGFNLYRSTDSDGEFQQVNAAMIPSQGGATTGSSYVYNDDSVSSGQTYYYLLEEVELGGVTRRYNDDMFTYTVPRLTTTAVVLTAVSAFIGLTLIFVGLRENQR